MTVCRFILGRAGSGKTHYCLQKMQELILKGEEPPAIFLLPEQATFLYERELAQMLSAHGFAGAQVTSFRRLCHHAAKNSHVAPLPQLSETGKMMLMARILEAERNNLRAFAAPSLRTGFASTMLDVLSELKTYAISRESIEEAATTRQQKEPTSHLTAKLSDISLLYGRIEDFFAGRYTDFEDSLTYLAKEIKERGFLAGATVLIDGFAGFTPQELRVIEALLCRAEKVEIALALDPEQINEVLTPESLFYPTWDTYQKLKAIAFATGAKIEEPLLCWGEEGRFAKNPELAFLEKNLFAYTNLSTYEQAPKNISLCSAPHKEAEVEAVGRKILRLVREEGLRYRNISVITRKVGDYEQILERVFGSLGIPFFTDSKKPLIYHPLVELIRSALEVARDNWQYETVFRYFKTGLSPLGTQEIDILENYCLSTGIRHYHWTEKKDWSFWRRPLGEDMPEEKEEEIICQLEQINELRRRGSAPLLRFYGVVAKGKSVADICHAILTLLDDLDINAKLEKWQNEAFERGNGESVEIHSQILQKTLALLQEVELLLGEEIMTLDVFSSVLDAGFATTSLTIIPPGLDQVFVASLERSRNPEVKAAFILGVNTDVLPTRIMPDGIFSTRDREQLQQDDGWQLAPPTFARQLAENYLVYIALTRSGERLRLSYYLSDEEGEASLPSPVIKRIRTIFPYLTEEMYAGETDLSLLGGGLPTLASLSRQLRLAQNGLPVADFWRDVYNWYASEEPYIRLLEEILYGLDYDPAKNNLSDASINGLYGKNIRSSVSRLEKYRACPFSYFAAYGLKLQERPIYQLTAIDRGQLFHEALAVIGRRIHDEGKPWQDVDEAYIDSLIDECLERLLPRFLGNILSSSARYQYIARRIKITLRMTLLMMAEHMKKGFFVPVAWEVSFGKQRELPSLKIPLEDGRTLEISGKIDRIDLAKGAQGSWMRVIDYKTGRESLSVQDVFNGLKMQLLVYLQVVMDNAGFFGDESASAAGVYYSMVRDEMISGEMARADEEDAKLPGLRLEGLSVLDSEAVSMADPGLSGYSKLIPAAMKSDGGFYAKSPGVTPEQMDLLRQHLAASLRNLAGQMLGGLVAAAPLQGKNFDACAYCDYKAFCGFDRELTQNSLRLPKQKTEEIWQALEHEQEGKNG